MPHKSPLAPLLLAVCLNGAYANRAYAAYLAFVSPGYIQAKIELDGDVSGGSTRAWDGPNSLDEYLLADEPNPNFSISEASTVAPYRGSDLELEFRTQVYVHGSVEDGFAELYTRYNIDVEPQSIPVQIQPYPFGEAHGQPVRVDLTATYRPTDGIHDSVRAPERNFNAYRVTINGGDLLPATFDNSFAQPVVSQSTSFISEIGATFYIGMLTALFAASDAAPGAPAGLASSYLGLDMSVTVLDEPPPPPPLNVGDFNGNGIVDAADYTVWRDTLGRSVVPGTGADVSYDGVIDDFDYGMWKLLFGYRPPAATAVVPEPTTCCLLLTLALAAPLTKHRRR